MTAAKSKKESRGTAEPYAQAAEMDSVVQSNMLTMFDAKLE
jgi:hypothetical protein